MSVPFIETREVKFSYDDLETEDGKESYALRGVSTVIERGEYVAVVGRNGSGKSTFAKLLNLVLEPNSGDILIDGKSVCGELTDEEIIELRRSIGMVFQNPDNQIVATIVEEDVAFGPENIGVPSEEIRMRVDDALAAVGMSDFALYEPHRLSGGQKQRVAIAGIIAMMPDCMIFDESTAMLDPLGRRDIMNTIEKLNREHGITIIMITHYMDEAARANRIVVLDDGEVLMDGTPVEIFAHPERLEKCGLDVPQCVSVVHTLKKYGINIEGECHTPTTCADAIERALKRG